MSITPLVACANRLLCTASSLRLFHESANLEQVFQSGQGTKPAAWPEDWQYVREQCTREAVL